MHIPPDPSTEGYSRHRLRSLWLLAAACAIWFSCFLGLRFFGTWIPFAIAGLVLATAILLTDADARRLMRPSLGPIVAGLLVGGAMVALTHAGFALVSELVPQVRADTEKLFDLLNVGGFSTWTRAGLILVVASSEEVIFRGPLLDVRANHACGNPQPASELRRRQFRRVIAMAAIYALTTVSLGAPLLVACAFACAIVWGSLRVFKRSLLAAMIAHVIWDLGSLVVWPLVGE